MKELESKPHTEWTTKEVVDWLEHYAKEDILEELNMSEGVFIDGCKK